MSVQKLIPRLGDGNGYYGDFKCYPINRLEIDSPSRGRKPTALTGNSGDSSSVQKLIPRLGDGNLTNQFQINCISGVQKLIPRLGDGNTFMELVDDVINDESLEIDSPSRGRKQVIVNKQLQYYMKVQKLIPRLGDGN